MAPSLDAELEERFLAIAKCGRTAWLAGDIAEAERRFLESRDMIPERNLLMTTARLPRME